MNSHLDFILLKGLIDRKTILKHRSPGKSTHLVFENARFENVGRVQFENIAAVTLTSCPASQSGVPDLDLVGLSELYVDGTCLAVARSFLAKSDNLRELQITEAFIDENLEATIGALNKINSLGFFDCVIEPSDGSWIQRLPALKTLHLTGSRSPTGKLDIGYLSSLHTLEFLDLGRTGIGREELSTLQARLEKCEIWA
jgi:hypothetical protein